MVCTKLNFGVDFDISWLDNININLPAVKLRAETLGTRRTVKKQWQAAWLLKAVTCVDLTTLSGDDTASNVHRLCLKAKNPVRADLLEGMKMENKGITTGAVCVYPGFVAECVQFLKHIKASNIPVASVATGFPSGQISLKCKLEEIQQAVNDGASEIDIVISRKLVLAGKWRELYDELVLMKKTCGNACMKTIIATGELGSLKNVYKTSLVCMMAGADFIKTSTGKEAVNATLIVGITMVRAIREYYERTGYRVGFKPAGGIRTSKDAILWLILIKEELGNEWLQPSLFRLGASSLLTDIERQLFHYVTGNYAAAHEFAMT